MPSPRGPRAARQVAFLLLTFWVSGSLHAASFPPSYRFSSLSTERLTVHFHQGLEPMAREAATLAESILAAHEARYQSKIAHLHIVIADNEDDPNGFASALPYPTVSIRAASPDGSDQFGNLESWLRLVLTHELAHSVHLEQARGVMRLGRKILGRAPYLFPNVFTPTWLIEGLATYEETEDTAFGRGRNPDARMVRRMAVLEERFPHQDQAVLGLDKWPAGQTAYLFGESFLRTIEQTAGEGTIPELARVQSGKVIPFIDDLTAHQVTGSTFDAWWNLYRDESNAAFAKEGDALARRGLTESKELTRRGIRQEAPRFSPDGSLIAYSSRTLTRYPALRVMRADGTDDRRVADRSGGSGLSWTPDGKSLVFDEFEIDGLFSRRSDLRIVDVETGRVRKLTKGLRARDPDVSPDGKTIVFVRRMGDRSELHTLPIAGGEPTLLTRSTPGTEWSGPRWRPQGDVIVASRLLPGGLLDLVLVDPRTGDVTAITDDRAKDVEPAWTPDGEHIVFRSDRDGVSNLYAWRRRDKALLLLTNVLGGAFTPSVGADGRTVVFADYSSRGFDLHTTQVDLTAAPSAPGFVDSYPVSAPAPQPSTLDTRSYRPLPAMLPRFWTPVILRQDDEWRYGAATAGVDPLYRHSYGLTLYRGAESGRFTGLGFYQYDRFWPTFLVTYEDEANSSNGFDYRTRTLNLRASVPLVRRMRSLQSLSVTYRREEQASGDDPVANGLLAVDRGGIETAWSWSTVQQYPESISPVDGGRLRVAWLREATELGSDLSLSKFTGDARAYLRLFRERDVVALRVGGGGTRGEPAFRRTFAVGGYPDSSIFDLVKANEALLRGYPDDAYSGRNFAQANVEYRFPLGSPQRGWRTLPLFVRHLRGSAFFDAAHTWNRDFRFADVKTAAGVGVGVDAFLANRLPFTGEAVLARGFASLGDTRFYLRVGLAF